MAGVVVRKVRRDNSQVTIVSRTRCGRCSLPRYVDASWRLHANAPRPIRMPRMRSARAVFPNWRHDRIADKGCNVSGIVSEILIIAVRRAATSMSLRP